MAAESASLLREIGKASTRFPADNVGIAAEHLDYTGY
jgi:hypothetical protein